MKSDKEDPALIAEEHFTKALALDPTINLTYANLCLLYRTDYFKEGHDKEKFLGLCRFYGHKVIHIWPDYINGYFDFIESLVCYEEFEEASDVYHNFMNLPIATEKKKNEIEIGKTRILGKVKEVDKRKLKLFI